MDGIALAVIDAEVLAAVICVLEGGQLPRLADAELAARLRAAVIPVGQG